MILDSPGIEVEAFIGELLDLAEAAVGIALVELFKPALRTLNCLAWNVDSACNVLMGLDCCARAEEYIDSELLDCENEAIWFGADWLAGVLLKLAVFCTKSDVRLA
jgi:hypothetical protein